MNAVTTAENRPACIGLEMIYYAGVVWTHKNQESIDILFGIQHSILIELTNKIIDPSPPSAFRFDSDTLNFVIGALGTILDKCHKSASIHKTRS